MTDMRQVHADLMGAPGAEREPQQVGLREARHHRRVRHRVAAAGEHRHPLAILGMPRDRRLDVDGAVREVAPGEGSVDALDFALLDQAGEAPVRAVGLRDEQQSRGVAVEPAAGGGAGGDGAGQRELTGDEAVEALGLGGGEAERDGGHQGSAAVASFARSCARPSSQRETASAIAPTVMAESATLKVGQRAEPIPTSTKSTTPCALRRRSTTLPTAPAHTSASETMRNRSRGRAERTIERSTHSAAMASPKKIQRE